MTDINTRPLNEPTFGIVEFVHPDDAHRAAEAFKYTASRTGIILYPANQHSNPGYTKPQVVSCINGSMVIVPLGEVVDACNFDNYLTEWVLNNDYRPAKVKYGQPQDGIAYFDPETLTYTVQPTEAHLAQWPERSDLDPDPATWNPGV
jgi:hypothetical protein